MEKTIPNRKRCQLLAMKGLTLYTFDPRIRHAKWNEITKRLYEQNQKNDIIFSY